MRNLLVGMTVAGLLVTHDVGAVPPLDNTSEFLVGEFRMPATPPTEGAVPARLTSRPHVPCALPRGTWLRFENFGADRYAGWSVQLQIDDQGNLYQVEHLGDAKPEAISKPVWPSKPTQKLDAKTLAGLRAEATAFAAGAAYRAHEGLSYAPTFVVTVALDATEKQIFLDGYEDAFVQHLRRITQFAHESPLDGKKAKPAAKPAAKKP